MSAQCLGKSMSNLDGGLAQAPLNEAHVSAVKASLVSEPLLRKSLRAALAPNDLRKGG